MKLNNCYLHLMRRTDLDVLSQFLTVHTEEGFAATVAFESYNWFLWKNQVRHHPKCGHPKYRSAP